MNEARLAVVGVDDGLLVIGLLLASRVEKRTGVRLLKVSLSLLLVAADVVCRLRLDGVLRGERLCMLLPTLLDGIFMRVEGAA